MQSKPLARVLALRRWHVGLIVVLLLIPLGLWCSYKGSPRRKPAAPKDPRLTFASPFQNIRPDVEYVGDAACARCHPEIAATYRRHPMGQSLLPVAEAPILEHFEPSPTSFEASGFRYVVERRGSRVFHTEAPQGSAAQDVAQIEAEVEFALGSGTRGRAYLFNRNGYLFQSPISWFSQKQCWDLSPGYERHNYHFERPIMASCLFCHSNHAEEVEHTRNRYELPIFRGYAIGCERCHGPGQLHAREPNLHGDVDYQIVNPRRLEPVLREAVCQQCHLQGAIRVLRANQRTFDYRPGLPLQLFWSVFVRPDDSTGNKAVGQVEQMYSSRCFRGSNGDLGCISCHDPHRIPESEERLAYFRERCLNCHDTGGCGLPIAIRTEQSKEDSCTQCHMPEINAKIAHTAMTDHRILRRPEKAGEPLRPTRGLRPGENPLVHFHGDLLDPQDPAVSRDTGVALVLLAWVVAETPIKASLGRLAQPLLQSAVTAWPEDVSAWEALGYAHWVQGHPQEAQESSGTALTLAPSREFTLVDLAELTERVGRRDAAIAYWQRAIAVNPYLSWYHAELAQLSARSGDWQRAVDAYQDALRLNPADREMRKGLVMALLRLGSHQQARNEFNILLQSHPPADHEALKKWFAEQAR